MSGHRGALRIADLDLIACLGAGVFDGARGEFQHVNCFADGAGAPWPQNADSTQHAQVAVEKNHVDWKSHTNGVDAIAPINE